MFSILADQDKGDHLWLGNKASLTSDFIILGVSSDQITKRKKVRASIESDHLTGGQKFSEGKKE